MPIPIVTLEDAVKALAEVEPLLTKDVYRVALSDQVGGWRIVVDAPRSPDCVRMVRRLGGIDAPALARQDGAEHVTTYVARRGRARIDVVLHERIITRVSGRR